MLHLHYKLLKQPLCLALFSVVVQKISIQLNWVPRYPGQLVEKEVLPGKRTGSWELGHPLKPGSPFLKLLFHKAGFVADQDVKQKISIASEDWFVSRFTPEG